MSIQSIQLQNNLLNTYNDINLIEVERNEIVQLFNTTLDKNIPNRIITEHEFNNFLSRYFSSLMNENTQDIEKIKRVAKFCVKNKIKIHTTIKSNKLQLEKFKRIETIKNEISQNPVMVCKNIQHFELNPRDPDDKQLLILIAQATVEHNEKGAEILCTNIQNFGLNPQDPEDKQTLIDIAKIVAMKESSEFYMYLQTFGLNPQDPEDKQTLIKLAKIFAFSNPNGICKHFKKFGLNPEVLEDKKILIDIAKIVAKKNSIAFCLNIQTFGLNPQNSTDKLSLIDLAKIVAYNSPSGFCKHFKKFRLDLQDQEDKKTLLDIARIVVKEDPFEFCENMEKFGLDSQDPKDKPLLIELAKAAAVEYPFALCSCVQEFGLNPNNEKDKLVLIDIAKIVAREDPKAICDNIREFGLNTQNPADRQVLIDLAKIVAREDPKAICKNIEKFGLDPKNPADRQVLIDLAKITAARNGLLTSQYVRKFGLNPKKAPEVRQGLIEIFKIALKNTPWTFTLIDEYRLKFKSVQDKILFEEILNSVFLSWVTAEPGEDLNQFILIAKFDSYSQDRLIFLIAYAKRDLGEMERLVNEALSEMEGLKPLTDLEGLSKRNQVNALVLLRYTLFKLRAISNSESKKLLPILKEIFSIPQPRLRFLLIDRLHEVVSDPSKKAAFFALQDRSKAFFTPPLLYCILTDMDAKAMEAIEGSLNKRPFKKDGTLRRFTLDSLESLFQLSELDLGSKRWLISELFKEPPRHLKKTSRLLKTMVTLGQGEGLNQKELEEWKETSLQASLKKQFSVHFKKMIPISLENQDLYEKYEKKMGQFRDEAALLQYMHGSIKQLSLEEQKPLEGTYIQFIESLLNGNFHDWRYSTEFNRHLKEVFQDNIQVEEAWKKGLVKDLGSSDDTGAVVLNFKKEMKDSLKSGHFQKSQFPELDDYINTEDESIKKELARKLKEEKEQLTELEIKRFSFTLKAIDLMDKPDQKEKLSLLNNLLKLKLATGQFKRDLEDWIKMLKQTQSQKANKALKVVEGDDPCDLLMCGTEVLGSCQSIYGDPSLNKCLMGYIANGQNRLIAVKDLEGKIEARALIRILLKEGSPVLFLERLYPANIRDQEKKAIYEMAIAKAQLMGLPLYENNTDVTEDSEIQCVGGQSLFDYVDALDGLAVNSAYTIQNYSLIE